MELLGKESIEDDRCTNDLPVCNRDLRTSAGIHDNQLNEPAIPPAKIVFHAFISLDLISYINHRLIQRRNQFTNLHRSM